MKNYNSDTSCVICSFHMAVSAGKLCKCTDSFGQEKCVCVCADGFGQEKYVWLKMV